jgi:prepilin-type N-terminal cleavage/methylation domain-containing protein
MVKRGFTLFELLIVLAIAMTILGLGIPAMASARAKAKRQATRALVQTVATAIAQYPTAVWTVAWDDDGDDPNRTGRNAAGTARATPPKSFSGHCFDLNQAAGKLDGDGLIDGRPDADGPFWSELVASGYQGFLGMTHLQLTRNQVDAKGRPCDPWKQPLHIAWSADAYGATGFGVWSIGADGKDGTTDDLTSWSTP